MKFLASYDTWTVSMETVFLQATCFFITGLTLALPNQKQAIFYLSQPLCNYILKMTQQGVDSLYIGNAFLLFMS